MMSPPGSGVSVTIPTPILLAEPSIPSTIITSSVADAYSYVADWKLFSAVYRIPDLIRLTR